MGRRHAIQCRRRRTKTIGEMTSIYVFPGTCGFPREVEFSGATPRIAGQGNNCNPRQVTDGTSRQGTLRHNIKQAGYILRLVGLLFRLTAWGSSASSRSKCKLNINRICGLRRSHRCVRIFVPCQRVGTDLFSPLRWAGIWLLNMFLLVSGVSICFSGRVPLLPCGSHL